MHGRRWGFGTNNGGQNRFWGRSSGREVSMLQVATLQTTAVGVLSPHLDLIDLCMPCASGGAVVLAPLRQTDWMPSSISFAIPTVHTPVMQVASSLQAPSAFLTRQRRRLHPIGCLAPNPASPNFTSVPHVALCARTVDQGRTVPLPIATIIMCFGYCPYVRVEIRYHPDIGVSSVSLEPSNLPRGQNRDGFWRTDICRMCEIG